MYTYVTISREREIVCARVNIKLTKVRTTAGGGQEQAEKCLQKRQAHRA